MSDPLRLGIIGMSPGNGHPYSWSAICNGYDPILMEDCGFPAIPRYLEMKKYPEDFIRQARVTHIWTQDYNLSEHIAAAAKIDHVVHNLSDLVNSVDAVLLARDDADAHLTFALPFLEAGLPIYIDKPLAFSVNEATKILHLQRYPGQVFSCSALRYADELSPELLRIANIGPIRSIVGSTPKDWDKYSVHVIEPLLRFLPINDEVVRTSSWNADGRSCLHVQFSSGIDASIFTFGDCHIPITLKIIGVSGCLDLQLNDTFKCFKHALQDFIFSAAEKRQRISNSSMLRVVSIIEAGRTFS